MVLSTGQGVNGFTLDESLGEFILTHPDITIPSRGKIYSFNEGNSKYFDEPTKKYCEWSNPIKQEEGEGEDVGGMLTWFWCRWALGCSGIDQVPRGREEPLQCEIYRIDGG